MALDALGIDPCSKLNTTSYPNLWLTQSSSESDAYPVIAIGGIPQTFLMAIRDYTTKTGGLTGNVLARTEPNSSFRLIQFLSSGGVAGGQFGSLESIVLRSGNTLESIVDSFFSTVSNYSTSIPGTSGFSELSDSQINTIIQELQRKGYLLKKEEIYIETQLGQLSQSPAVASQSLIYLYKVEIGNTPLSGEQQSQKVKLESKNLRFFSAFLAEYCFYRTRYQWLLKKYFSIYTTSPYTSPTSGSAPLNALVISGTNTLTQAGLLEAIAKQLAMLNKKMTDMRRLLSKVNDIFSQITKEIQNNINNSELIGSNADLTKTINALQDSAKESKKYLSEADFAKGVMDYNQEKNRYAGVLLGLYAILNVSALAMIWKLK
jgi:hypothetical protein